MEPVSVKSRSEKPQVGDGPGALGIRYNQMLIRDKGDADEGERGHAGENVRRRDYRRRLDQEAMGLREGVHAAQRIRSCLPPSTKQCSKKQLLV